ncbi:MAG TPA: hypothetical protein VF577_01630, partial [Allosphingosinicella sp.]
MATYSTPGVYIEEISVFPPSIAPVATAVPAFIGYTVMAKRKTDGDIAATPVRIASLLEFRTLFGEAPAETLNVTATKRITETGALLGVDVDWTGDRKTLPAAVLYYSLQLYFDNGGGPCYVYSLGNGGGTADPDDYLAAIAAIEAVDEPTLLLFPDAAAEFEAANYATVVNAALASCAKLQDRFVIADVPGARLADDDDDPVDVDVVVADFRGNVSNVREQVKYGASYFPFVRTNLPLVAAETDVEVTLVVDQAPNAPASSAPAGLETFKTTDTAVYAAVDAFVSAAYATIPASGAVAGIYAQTDRSRGVWKAPANVSLNRVLGPAVMITDEVQDRLNVDATSGKSVNALRAFFGKGTLVWGGRTLAGNDNEWRYVNVRRFANFVEESVKK